MPLVNSALRERLQSRKTAMSSRFIIDNKNFVKGVFRILRNYDTDEEPGFKYVSYYNKELKIGTTSPQSFGLRCPIQEFLDSMRDNGASKDDSDLAWKTVQPSTEYWILVLDMDNPGTAESPGLHILRSKRVVYDQILGQMLDEDSGSDVCDLEEGRDIVVKKTGVQLDTKWSVTWRSDAPISDDADYIAAVRNSACTIKVPGRFYSVDWDKLGQLYEHLTGEAMPDEFREQEGADSGAKEGEDDAPVAAPKAAAKAAAKAAPAAAGKGKLTGAKPAPAPEPEAVADDGDAGGANPDIVFHETRVTLKDENDADLGGLIIGYDDKLGEYDIQDDNGEVWGMKADEFTIVEAEAEPVAAAPVKRRVAKPAAAAPAAAKAAPAKAAAGPRKPASMGIRARLK